jgi:hypothetical protein
MNFDILDKIISNNGHINTFAGILVVFFGLIAISVAIVVFNKAAFYFQNKQSNKKDSPLAQETNEVKITNIKDIPEDELVAISVAVEVYRKLHFEIMQNEVTFTHGSAQTPWKMLQNNQKTIARVR